MGFLELEGAGGVANAHSAEEWRVTGNKKFLNAIAEQAGGQSMLTIVMNTVHRFCGRSENYFEWSEQCAKVGLKRTRLRDLYLATLFTALGVLGLGVANRTAYAQLTTADVLGTVTDSTGAVVPNAKITIRNLGTQVTASTKSNETGDYIFNLLTPGHYSVVIEAKGFKKVVYADVALAAGDRVREDGKLETGSNEETVVVTSAAPLLQTDSAAVTSVVTEQSVQDLPLNGRNYINLVQIQPGVNAGESDAISSGTRPDDRRAEATISANGQNDYNNNEMIDGMDNNEREQGFISVRPSIDAIAEVKVDTNAYSAEVGRTAGAVVNIVTKSGENAFHGSAYEFFRNDIFDARDFFARVGQTVKPEYRQNQFGGSVGGPIVKNKTFFFGDVEDNRIIQGLASGLLTVPTFYEQQNPGDFSDIGGPTLPTGTSPDPVGLAYFKMFPAPNVAGAVSTNNYTNVSEKTQYTLSLDGRIDQHFNNGDSLFGRYSYNNVSTLFPGALPPVSVDGDIIQPNGIMFNFAGPSTTKVHGVQFNYIHVLSPNLVLELKTGYTRTAIESNNLNQTSSISSTIGLVNANTPAAPETGGLMPLDFLSGGYASLGDSPYLPIIDTNNTFQYMGSLTYTHGAHNIKAGAQLIRRQLNYFQSTEPLGWVFFAGKTGNALEDLLEGNPYGYYRGNTLFKPGYRAWEYAGYVQDDWRATHSLTLNLGLRYEVFAALTEAHDKYSNFDYPTLSLITSSQDPHIGIDTNYKNISPRFGFSQSLWKGGVLRGGYGISYYPIPIQKYIQNANPPYLYANVCMPCATFWPTLPLPTPASASNLSGSLSWEPSNFNTSSVQQFNLMVQQQFKANVVTLGYVGELGRHQIYESDAVNIPKPAGPYPNDATQGPSTTPGYLTAQTLPNVNSIAAYTPWATSNYHAFQGVFARRFTRGLSFNANYTWAHGLSDSASGSGGNGGGSTPTGAIPSNVRYDYGDSLVDIRQRLSLNWNYEVPFWKASSGLKAVALKGWSLNSILGWQTGAAFTVDDAFTENPTGTVQINLPSLSQDRPDVTGKPYRVSNPGINSWINPAAFTAQAAGTAGNEINGTIHGPDTRRADLSLFKSFDLPNKFLLQFRAECYNISNTPNFSNPNPNISAWAAGPEHDATHPISNPTNDPALTAVGLLPGDTPTTAGGFGSISSTATNVNPRQFQFALKLLF